MKKEVEFFTKLPENVFLTNLYAGLAGLLRGMSIKVYREKVAKLPAWSKYSSITVSDRIVELETEDRLHFDDERELVFLKDTESGWRQLLEKQEKTALDRLEELGISIAELCPA